MASLGWAAPTFAENPIHWDYDHDAEAVVAGGGPQVPNTVGLSLGAIPDHIEQELGATQGGLHAVAIPVFLDIYGESRAVALNLADDLTGILQGVLWAPSRYVPLYDLSVDPPTIIPDRACEMTGIEARWPAGRDVEWRRRWRIVNATATVYYNAGSPPP